MLSIMMMMMNCFVVWLRDERCLVLFPVGTIVRDPHHRESLTRREQDQEEQKKNKTFMNIIIIIIIITIIIIRITIRID